MRTRMRPAFKSHRPDHGKGSVLNHSQKSPEKRGLFYRFAIWQHNSPNSEIDGNLTEMPEN